MQAQEDFATGDELEIAPLDNDGDLALERTSARLERAPDSAGTTSVKAKAVVAPKRLGNPGKTLAQAVRGRGRGGRGKGRGGVGLIETEVSGGCAAHSIRQEEGAGILAGGSAGAVGGLYPSLPEAKGKFDKSGVPTGKGEGPLWGGKFSPMDPGGWYQRRGAGKGFPYPGDASSHWGGAGYYPGKKGGWDPWVDGAGWMNGVYGG